jgi:hypothetical protein
LTSLELLIKENLFFLSPAIDVPASLSSLFQKAEEQGQLAQLLALIETIPDQHKLYIISSDAFVKADESSKSPNYDQNQARIRSEQDLIRAIEAGNLETAKPLMPKDVIPSTIAQHVLACATKSSSQHLDILLHFMQNGLKLTDLSNDALSDLFLAASRHGHLEAAIALVRQVFEKRTIDPMEGSRCMQLLQDRQGAYLEAALLCGNPEMTRFIRTVAVHGDLGVNEFMKKFETNQPLEQSRWEKFNVKWTQIKLGFYEAVVIFWNILKSPFRLIFG